MDLSHLLLLLESLEDKKEGSVLFCVFFFYLVNCFKGVNPRVLQLQFLTNL